jgi:hypothetical protein
MTLLQRDEDFSYIVKAFWVACSKKYLAFHYISVKSSLELMFIAL